MVQKKLFVLFCLALGLSACATSSNLETPSPAAPQPVFTPAAVAKPPKGVTPAPPVSSQAKAAQSTAWREGWYFGAEGYAEALEEYERTNKPMAVYVEVNWCPYCRKFEREVLSSPLVREYLKDKIKVNINPENSKQENTLAFQYSVQGFPSFYVHPPQPSGTVRLFTNVRPEKFIENFEQTLK